MASCKDLVSVVVQLSSCRTLEQIIQVLRDSTRELTGADGVTVVLRDVDKCFYAEENAITPLWKGKRFPMSACISGWCMTHRQQVIISDVYADARIPHDAYRPTFVKSLAMTPIRSADPLGAIGAYWASNHTATTEELNTLQVLGDSAAMALENIQLIQALKQAGERKDAFLSMLAHELRNPLNPVSSGLHLLRLQKTRPDVIEQTINMMDRQVGHMSRIIDDLLDVARLNNGKVELKCSKVDLATLLRECVDDRRKLMESARLAVALDVPMMSVWIDADSTRLTQIIGNLLDNARKYTPAGGKVSVVMKVDPDTAEARIDIRDTGIGIAPLTLPHLFEAFVQADTSLDRTGGGLGLGLAVASGLVALHGGSISAHSDGLGQGSCFSVTLPGVTIDAPEEEPAGTLASTIENQLRLLIIEDNEDAALTLQALLKACGYGASIAYDGSTGVDLAREQRPDIVLCDIGLPKMDGYEVAATLRNSKETAGTRLVAITGYGSDDDRLRCRKAGFDAHLVKPVNLTDLLGQLNFASAVAR